MAMTSHVKRLCAVVGAVGAIVMGTTMLAAGPASAQPLTCGSTITSSVTLTQDVDCTNMKGVNALTIGAPGVTVNLNGYQILGPVTGSNASGIIGGSGDLTIENGTISNFVQDVQVGGSSGLVLQNLAITNSAIGVHVGATSNASIHNLFVSTPGGKGMILDHCQGCTISRNDVADATLAFWDMGGSGNTWSSNTVLRATTGGILAQDTTDAVMEFNTVNGGRAAYGVDDQGATGSMITGNRLNGLNVAVIDQSSINSTVAFNFGVGDNVGIQAIDSSGVYHDNVFI
jgi:hypothetical protein